MLFQYFICDVFMNTCLYKSFYGVFIYSFYILMLLQYFICDVFMNTCIILAMTIPFVDTCNLCFYQCNNSLFHVVSWSYKFFELLTSMYNR